MWGSRFVGARAVGPWVGEQKPLGKTPVGGHPSPEMIYLPTFRAGGKIRTYLSFSWQWPFLRCRFATWRRHYHLSLH